MTEDKVACRTPAEGRDGVTNIPRWKFDMLREAILAVLAEGDIRFTDLQAAVGARLAAADLQRLGSLGWHVTTVKLELECRGEVVRRAVKGPQMIGLPPL